MRESRLFLNFFKNNFWLILTPTLILGLAGFYYQFSQPRQYQAGELLEMDYSDQNIPERIALTDQAVSLSRSEAIKLSKGISPFTKVEVFKSGPLAIQILVTGADPQRIDADLKKLDSFLDQKFPLKKIGVSTFNSARANFTLGALTGLGGGFLLGTLTSLIKEYFKSY